MDKFVVNVDRYGNTSTASIPIAAVEAVEKGQLKAGHKIVFVGLRAGLRRLGALAAEWTGPMPAKKHVHPEQYRLFARLRSLLRRALRYIEGLLSRRELLRNAYLPNHGTITASQEKGVIYANTIWTPGFNHPARDRCPAFRTRAHRQGGRRDRQEHQVFSGRDQQQKRTASLPTTDETKK